MRKGVLGRRGLCHRLMVDGVHDSFNDGFSEQIHREWVRVEGESAVIAESLGDDAAGCSVRSGCGVPDRVVHLADGFDLGVGECQLVLFNAFGINTKTG